MTKTEVKIKLSLLTKQLGLKPFGSGLSTLTYHGIVQQKKNLRLERNFLLEADFYAHMKALRKHRYAVINPAQIEYFLQQEDLSRIKKTVLLTFDDGYKNNEKAMEIMADFGFSAAFFLSTSAIGSSQSIWTVNLSLLLLQGSLQVLLVDDKAFPLSNFETRNRAFQHVRTLLKASHGAARLATYNAIVKQFPAREVERLLDQFSSLKMFNWQEVKALNNSGIFFQSHGHLHEVFNAAQTASTVCDELKTSKQILEEKLGKEISWYAYPNGDCDYQNLEKDMEQAGYKLGFALGEKRLLKGDNLFQIPRYRNPHGNINKFLYQLA